MTSLKLLATRVAVKLFCVSRWSNKKVNMGSRSLDGQKLSSNDLSKALSHKSGSQAFWINKRSSREVKMGPRSLGGQKAFQQ